MKDRTTTRHTAEARIRSTLAIVAFCFCAFVILSAITSHDGVYPQAGPAHGDARRGGELFSKRCGGCHALDTDKEGPRLGNVYGRKAGTISTFKYSDSLKSAQIVWNDSLLDKWLINTETVVPDNDMDFHVPKADERADIIQFLRVSSGK
jgi:cytochrome c